MVGWVESELTTVRDWPQAAVTGRGGSCFGVGLGGQFVQDRAGLVPEVLEDLVGLDDEV